MTNPAVVADDVAKIEIDNVHTGPWVYRATGHAEGLRLLGK
jgi:hypothetical protein